MSFVRRSLTLVLATTVALGGLTLGASAKESGKGREAQAAQKPTEKVVSRGLIIKTTTAQPSQAVLAAADAALGDEAKVGEADTLTGKISTVDFDEVVSEDVASDAAKELTKRADVVWAVPNSLRKTARSSPVPRNDQYFAQQGNVWSTTEPPVGGYSIKAPYLWRATYGKPDVTVAVVDSGIIAHPDLEGQTVPGYDMIGPDQDDDGNSVGTFNVAGDGDGRDADPTDPGDWETEELCGENFNSSWHGTFIAGMIAAKSNNTTSISGIAPGVKVQPVRALGHCGGWDSDIIAGLTWASGGTVGTIEPNANKAEVVNLSLNWTYDNVGERNAACQLYSDAAAAGNARGSIFIAAAGNDSWDADLAVPSSCPGFVSVGATSMKGFSAFYSNGGPSVDLSAPGGDSRIEGSTDRIRSLANSGTHGPVSMGTSLMEGTSMSAAEVSAAAALLYSLGLSTPAEVETALKQSVSPFRAFDARYGNLPVRIDGSVYNINFNCRNSTYCGTGILDLNTIPAPISGASISGSAVIGETLVASPGIWNSNPALVYTWLRDGTTPVGTNSATYAPTAADETHTLTVKVTPANAAFAKITSTATPTAVVPHAPAVTMTPLTASLKYGQTATTTVTVAGAGAGGAVELRRGSTVLASGTTNESGVATIDVPGNKWVIGNNVVRASYVGSAGAASSTSSTVAVAKATPTIPWMLPTSIKKTQNAMVTVRVAVPAGVPYPTGWISVYDGSKVILKFPMYAYHKGVRAYGLPKFKTKGTHTIQINFYGGTTPVANAWSAKKTITVK